MMDGVLKLNSAEVPGYRGGMVQTTPEFAVVREWFGLTALDETGRTTLFNCTEGGARIDGMHHAPLAEVLSALPTRQVSTAQVVTSLAHSPELSDRKARLDRRAAACHQAIAEVGRLAKSCVTQIDAVERYPEAMARLQRLEQQLSNALKQAFVLSVAAQADIRRAVQEGGNAQSLAESLAASRRLYTVITDWAARLSAQ